MFFSRMWGEALGLKPFQSAFDMYVCCEIYWTFCKQLYVYVYLKVYILYNLCYFR